MLKGLNSQPSLLSADLYDNAGNIFASYQSPKKLKPAYLMQTLKRLLAFAKPRASTKPDSIPAHPINRLV